MAEMNDNPSERTYRFALPTQAGEAPAQVEQTPPETPSAAAQAEPPAAPVPELAEDVPEEETEDTKLVIKVGKTNYAVGLFWQPIQDADDPIEEISQTMETDPEFDLYCTHFGRAPQYAIGKRSRGHSERQVVAGIALLDALSDQSSFLAVFKVDEGWWFIAARNDLILAENDVLYTSEEDAKNAFFSMLSVPDWGYKIAPQSWHVEGTEEMDLEELLRNSLQVHLMSLGAMRSTKILIGVALIIIILLCGVVYGLYRLLQIAPTEKVDFKPEAPAQTDIKPVAPQQDEAKPWEQLVKVEPFLERCLNYSMQLKSLVVPGWGLGEIVCTPEQITTRWDKTWEKGGRLAWLESAYKEYKIDAKVVEKRVNETGTSAEVVVHYATKLPTDASTPTAPLKELEQEMVDISQALSVPMQLSVGEKRIGPAEETQKQSEDVIPARQSYRYLAFSFSSPFDPPAWETFFEKFTAMELVKITYQPRSESALNNNWSYEGRIYEK